MKKEITYRLVKGSRQHDFFGGFSSLWLAEDHLLLVRNSGLADRYKESYRRFYFRDIQALILAETKQRRNREAAFLLATLFFLTLAGLFRATGWIFYLPVALITLTGFLINRLKGPTCTARIVTAVQTTSLPCKRLPIAKRLEEELTACIEKVQGSFHAEQREKLDSRLQEISSADTQRASVSDHAKQTAGTEEFTLFFDRQAHLVTFFLLLLLAVISVISLGGRGQLLYTLETLLFAITLITIIIALYHQSRSRIRGMLAKLTWIAAAFLVLAAVANFGLIFEAMSQQAAVQALLKKEYGLWTLLGQVQPADSLYLRTLLIARTIGCTLLGSTGLWFSFRYGRVRTDADA